MICRKKMKYMICIVMLLLLYRFLSTHKVEYSQSEQDLGQSNKSESCEYRIAGIGSVFLDHPVSTEHGCAADQEEIPCEQDGSEHVHVWDRVRRPLHLHGYTPLQAVANEKPINNMFQKDNAARQRIAVGYDQYGLNQLLSDLIPVKRRLADKRSAWCRDTARLVTRLPKASVIITVHNEAMSVLLRAVNSVIQTTPAELLEEIIIVNDASDMEHLRKGFDSKFKDFDNVKILRIPKRIGFLSSRNKGALISSAPVLIFLDSNTECTPGWVEPLLARIAEDRSTVVSPNMDIIDQDTFEYATTEYAAVGGFNWNLIYQWININKDILNKQSNPEEPIPTPNLSGGNFAIDKEFFKVLGQHDPVLDTLGFDNLELSIKSWTCGGRVELIPCSHVGHVGRSFVAMPQAMMFNISMRTADVLLDEYKVFFQDRTGVEGQTIGDTSSRKMIRKQLGCRPFSWYVENVYPDLFNPAQSLATGELRNPWSALCIESGVTSDHYNQQVKLFPCNNMGGHQYWMFSRNGEIRRDEACLDFAGEGNGVILYPCHGDGGNQRWVLDHSRRRVRHQITRMCLTVSGDDTAAVPLPDTQNVRYLVLSDCQEPNLKQDWIWFWVKSRY